MEHTSEQPLRPEDELQYIRKIIDDSRASFVEDGIPYIIWGLLVAAGMIVSYISSLTERDLYAGYIWIGLVLFGWGSMIYYVIKQRRAPARPKSILDRIQSSIWGACGGTLGLGLILVLMFQHGANDPQMNPYYALFVTSLIVGIGYFLSGVVHDLKWLRNISFAWWAGAVAMYLWPSVHMIGLYAAMIILFQVVPGIILQRRYRRMVAASTPEA